MYLDCLHVTDNALSVTCAVVVEFLAAYVEAKGGVPVERDPTGDLSLGGSVDCSDHKLRVLSLEGGGERLILRCKLDAMPAVGGVVLNKNKIVILNGIVVGLVGQLQHILIVYLLRLLALLRIMELLDLALVQISEEVVQRIF